MVSLFVGKLLNSKFPNLWVFLKNSIFSLSSPFLCNYTTRFDKKAPPVKVENMKASSISFPSFCRFLSTFFSMTDNQISVFKLNEDSELKEFQVLVPFCFHNLSIYPPLFIKN
ncbi:hypothetical protein MKX03_010482 [Papaver bracteatum]|nr:hypothetical protein MKX03_010482 [Papaver bracteatum]